MIEVRRLTKKYGPLLAISDLNFNVPKGSVSGLVGANGAGKSTTLRILAGVLGATQGTVSVCGHDIVTAPLQARRCLGYLADNAPVYGDMSPRTYLLYRAALKGLVRAKRENYVLTAAKDAACLDYLDVGMGELSRGHRQRVGLADALLGRPPVILLDEPTAGLDPNQVQTLRELICQLREHHAIVLSSQALGDIEALCTNVLILHEGRLVADDTVENLRARHGEEVKLNLRDPDHRALNIIAQSGWQLCGTSDQAATRIKEIRIKTPLAPSEAGEAIEDLVAALTASGVGVRAVERGAVSLEAVFCRLTESDKRLSS